MSILDQPDHAASYRSSIHEISAGIISGASSELQPRQDGKYFPAGARGNQRYRCDRPRRIGHGRRSGAIDCRIAAAVSRDCEPHTMIFPDSWTIPLWSLPAATPGNTEETLSAYEQARRAKASIVCITSGGKLEAMATANGYPVASASREAFRRAPLWGILSSLCWLPCRQCGSCRTCLSPYRKPSNC